MIVKVSRGVNEAAHHHEAGEHVSSGTWFFDEPHVKRNYGDIAIADPLHVCGVDDSDISPLQSGQWAVRYAWWYDKNNRLVMVVTSGDIFVLSESGKTIDKVR